MLDKVIHLHVESTFNSINSFAARFFVAPDILFSGRLLSSTLTKVQAQKACRDGARYRRVPPAYASIRRSGHSRLLV